MLAADRQNELDPFDIIALVCRFVVVAFHSSFFHVRPCRIVGGDRADFFFLVAWHTNANRNYGPFGHLYPRASLKGGILFESIYLFFQEHSYVATQSR